MSIETVNLVQIQNPQGIVFLDILATSSDGLKKYPTTTNTIKSNQMLVVSFLVVSFSLLMLNADFSRI